MKYIWTVARREIVTRLRRPSFYLVSLLMPLLAGAIIFGTSLLSADAAVELGDEVGETLASAPSEPSGYVDQAGVVQDVPFDLHPFFVPFPDEATAAAALRDGQIASYFVIVPDYASSGRVAKVSRQASFFGGAGADVQAMQMLLRANVAGDAALAQRIDQPLNLHVEPIVATELPDGGNEMDFSIPGFALAMVLAFAIINGGGWLVQAVVEEKENRTVEVILTSVRPVQLMAGKLFGLGTVALLQLAIWMVLGGGILGVGVAVGLSALGVVPWSAWLWLIVFFLLGFGFYGAIMMMFGALGATVRESQQVSGFMTLPMFVPLWFGGPISENPNGVLAQALSYIPFTAPLTIMLRVGVTTVPLWQILLSAAVLAAFVGLAVWLAARLFRSTTLLTGVRPTPRALWRVVRGV